MKRPYAVKRIYHALSPTRNFSPPTKGRRAQRIDKVRFVDAEGGQRLKFCGISGRRWVESTDSSGFAYGICANPPYMPLDLI